MPESGLTLRELVLELRQEVAHLRREHKEAISQLEVQYDALSASNSERATRIAVLEAQVATNQRLINVGYAFMTVIVFSILGLAFSIFASGLGVA